VFELTKGCIARFEGLLHPHASVSVVKHQARDPRARLLVVRNGGTVFFSTTVLSLTAV